MEVLDICLKVPVISSPTIIMSMLFLMMELLDCFWVTEEVDLGHKRPGTLNLEIVEFIIVVVKEVKME